MEQANGASQPGIRLMRRACACPPSPEAGRPLGDGSRMEALWKRSRCQDGMLGTAGGLMEGIAGHNGLTVTKSVRLSGWRVRPPAAAVIAIVFDGAEPIFVGDLRSSPTHPATPGSQIQGDPQGKPAQTSGFQNKKPGIESVHPVPPAEARLERPRCFTEPSRGPAGQTLPPARLGLVWCTSLAWGSPAR